jgi:D-alanyl-D-alanine carboxypeptidase
MKHTLYCLLALAFIVFPNIACSQEKTEIYLDEQTTVRGYTVKSPDEIVDVAIRPGTLERASTVRIMQEGQRTDPPDGMRFASLGYLVSLAQDVPSRLTTPISITIHLRPSLHARWIAYFDTQKGEWQRLATKNTQGGVQAWTKFPHLAIAVLESSRIASQYALSAKAASAIGTMSGERLLSFHDEERHPIASITKLASAIVFLEQNIPWDRTITYQKKDERIGSRVSLRIGETWTVRNAFESMLVGSANNATMSLVHASGLSEKEFVQRMNAWVRERGMTNTNFVEPTGLDERNISTAYDVALLAREAFQNASIAQSTGRISYTFKTRNAKRRHVIRTTNRLQERTDDIRRGKTGYTDEAGYCLVVQTRETEKHGSYIATVLGNRSSNERYQDMHMLTDMLLTST